MRVSKGLIGRHRRGARETTRLRLSKGVTEGGKADKTKKEKKVELVRDIVNQEKGEVLMVTGRRRR